MGKGVVFNQQIKRIIKQQQKTAFIWEKCPTLVDPPTHIICRFGSRKVRFRNENYHGDNGVQIEIEVLQEIL